MPERLQRKYPKTIGLSSNFHEIISKVEKLKWACRRFLLSTFLLMVLVGVFQNCTPSKFAMIGPESWTTQESGGNGQGYDGKIVIVHHIIPGFTCEGFERPESILVQVPNGQWYLTKNTPEKCEVIKSQPVTGVVINPVTGTYQYQDQIFVPPPVLLVDKLEDPNLPDLDQRDGICRNLNGKCSLRAAFEELPVLIFNRGVTIQIPAGDYILNSVIKINFGSSSSYEFTVQGEGVNSTFISGSSAGTRLFDFNQANFKFLDLTLRNGLSNPTTVSSFGEGGGATKLSMGQARFQNVNFVNNIGYKTASALSSLGTFLVIDHCLFEGNRVDTPDASAGSALYHYTATLYVQDSTFRNQNDPANFANILVKSIAYLTIRRTSIYNNFGHGIYIETTGNRNQYIENSTMTNNSLSGIYFYDFVGSGILNIRNSTLVNNGTAQPNTSGRNLFLFTTAGTGPSILNIFNNILQASGGTGGNCLNFAGGFTMNADANLMSDASCGFAGTIIGDALLAPMSDNGGLTPTMMPTVSSPALGQGNTNQCLPTDQRSITRNTNQCTIGSVQP